MSEEESADTVDQDTEDESSANEDIDIYLVPTSHVSEKSSNLVRSTIERYKPELIAIELDSNRLHKLKNRTENETEDKRFIDFLKSSGDVGIKGRLLLVLFGMVQSNISNKLGMDLLGIDMLAGYEASVEYGIPLALVDKDVKDTFNQFSDAVSFTEAFKSVFYLLIGYVHISRMSDEEMKEDVGEDGDDIDISESVESLEEFFPTFKRFLIDERNEHIAEKTLESARQFGDTVLVIGAAHKKGVEQILSKNEDVSVHTITDDSSELIEE